MTHSKKIHVSHLLINITPILDQIYNLVEKVDQNTLGVLKKWFKTHLWVLFTTKFLNR